MNNYTNQPSYGHQPMDTQNCHQQQQLSTNMTDIQQSYSQAATYTSQNYPVQHSGVSLTNTYGEYIHQQYPSGSSFQVTYPNYTMNQVKSSTLNTYATPSKSPSPQRPQRVANNISQMAVNAYPSKPLLHVSPSSMPQNDGYQRALPKYSPNQYQQNDDNISYSVNMNESSPNQIHQTNFHNQLLFPHQQNQFSNQQTPHPEQHQQFPSRFSMAQNQSNVPHNYTSGPSSPNLPGNPNVILHNLDTYSCQPHAVSNNSIVYQHANTIMPVNNSQYPTMGHNPPHFNGPDLTPPHPHNQVHGNNQNGPSSLRMSSNDTETKPLSHLTNLSNVYPVSYVQHPYQVTTRNDDVSFNIPYNQPSNTNCGQSQNNNQSFTEKLIHRPMVTQSSGALSINTSEVVAQPNGISNRGSIEHFKSEMSPQTYAAAESKTHSRHESSLSKGTNSETEFIQPLPEGPTDDVNNSHTNTVNRTTNDSKSPRFTSLKTKVHPNEIKVSRSEKGMSSVSNAARSGPVKLIKQTSVQMMDHLVQCGASKSLPKTLIISPKNVAKEESTSHSGVLEITGVVKNDQNSADDNIIRENNHIDEASTGDEKLTSTNVDVSTNVNAVEEVDNVRIDTPCVEDNPQPEMDSEVSSTNSSMSTTDLNMSPTKARQRKQILIVKDMGEHDFELVTNHSAFMPFGKKKHRTLRVIPNKKFLLASSSQVYSGPGDAVLSRVQHRNVRILNSRIDDRGDEVNDIVVKRKGTIILDARTGVARWPNAKNLSNKDEKQKDLKDKCDENDSPNESAPSSTLSHASAFGNSRRVQNGMITATMSPTKVNCAESADVPHQATSSGAKITSGEASSHETVTADIPHSDTSRSSIASQSQLSSVKTIKDEPKEIEEPKFICSWNSDDDDVVMDTVDDSVINENDDLDFEPAYIDNDSNDRDDMDSIVHDENDDLILKTSLSPKNLSGICLEAGLKSTKRIHRTPKKYENCHPDIKTPDKNKDVAISKKPKLDMTPLRDRKKKKSESPKTAVSRDTIEPQSGHRHDQPVEEIKVNKSPPPCHSDKKKASNKLRGPFILMEGTKDNPSSVKIVNELHDEQTQSKVNGNKSQKTQGCTSVTTHISNLSSDKSILVEGPLSVDDTVWFCAICKKHSSYKFLGDLFGPYYDVGFEPKGKKDAARQTKQCAFVLSNNLTNEWLVPKQGKGRGGVASKTREVWVHETCALWSGGVYLLGNKLYGLREASAISLSTMCSVCREVGANIGCLHKGCTQKFHYICAYDTDCFMDEENFTVLCLKHKDKRLKKATVTCL